MTQYTLEMVPLVIEEAVDDGRRARQYHLSEDTCNIIDQVHLVSGIGNGPGEPDDRSGFIFLHTSGQAALRPVSGQYERNAFTRKMDAGHETKPAPERAFAREDTGDEA